VAAIPKLAIAMTELRGDQILRTVAAACPKQLRVASLGSVSAPQVAQVAN